ncbi:GNAT family N-acetyltransferase [Streptomyces avermitilis]|uniref:GNAT family N-acetyltransferase n=1 Tax=Streptomyces avermitilis TaxID=33903 RepID=UPI0036B1E9F2
MVEDKTGDLVGLAAYSFLWSAAGSSHSLFLKESYVRDTLRRRGVGARLMDEPRALAAARPGCSRVEWIRTAQIRVRGPSTSRLGSPSSTGGSSTGSTPERLERGRGRDARVCERCQSIIGLGCSHPTDAPSASTIGVRR